jgi:two-component system chemotaxis response regulator CheB
MIKTKVLVVDDSAFMRKIVTDILNESNDFEVVDTARNGQEAIDKIQKFKPDVVTLDIEMPLMDGLTALEIIMSKHPVPVLMLSSLTQEGAEATIRALDLGAVDFITKPSSLFKITTDDVKKELLEKVRIASHVKLKAQVPISPMKPRTTVSPTVTPRSRSQTDSFRKLVAIGTSTGGPRALQSVLPKIPADIDAGIVVVQHMPVGFTKSLADRLNQLSEIQVTEAIDGEQIKAGCAYIAPGDRHLRVIQRSGYFYISLGTDGLVTGHKPSVDAMMESIADLNISNVIAVIMTGMGSDGAKGVKRIKDNKGYVIAQDEESCVVYGMPKSAIKATEVNRIVNLEVISSEIVKAMGV